MSHKYRRGRIQPFIPRPSSLHPLPQASRRFPTLYEQTLLYHRRPYACALHLRPGASAKTIIFACAYAFFGAPGPGRAVARAAVSATTRAAASCSGSRERARPDGLRRAHTARAAFDRHDGGARRGRFRPDTDGARPHCLSLSGQARPVGAGRRFARASTRLL